MKFAKHISPLLNSKMQKSAIWGGMNCRWVRECKSGLLSAIKNENVLAKLFGSSKENNFKEDLISKIILQSNCLPYYKAVDAKNKKLLMNF